MKVLDAILTYGGFAVTCLTTILAFIMYKLKGKKATGLSGLTDILLIIPKLVETAEEQFGEKKGFMKLDYVMDKIQLFALQNKISINYEDIKKYVNDFVACTKKVNTFELIKPSANSDGGSADVNEVAEAN